MPTIYESSFLYKVVSFNFCDIKDNCKNCCFKITVVYYFPQSMCWLGLVGQFFCRLCLQSVKWQQLFGSSAVAEGSKMASLHIWDLSAWFLAGPLLHNSRPMPLRFENFQFCTLYCSKQVARPTQMEGFHLLIRRAEKYCGYVF